MEIGEGPDDDGPVFPWLPPEDRLWRHPSEMARAGAAPPRRTSSAGRVWTVAVTAGLLGAVVASGVMAATGRLEHRTTVIEQVSTPRSVLDNTDRNVRSSGWPAVADSMAPSVAAITVTGPDGTVQGSGLLYAVSRNTTYLLTSADLLIGGGGITASFDASQPVPAKVVGTDTATGLALLAVGEARNAVPAFGTVSDVAVAEPVLAVGSRTGNSVSIAPGSISGLDQAVDAGGTSLFGLLAVSGMPVGSLSDGGAIVDEYGQVIGIETDTTTLADQTGLTYAVPIDVAQHVASQLLDGRAPTHPWLGLESTSDLSTSAASSLGVAGGAEVGVVAPGSPAARAGIDANDVVTSFDGHLVTSAGALTALLASARPGHKARVAYLDNGQRRTVTVVVAEQPTDASP